MTSKLGVYWSVMHRRANDYDYFRRLQPSVFKVMDGGPPDYQWARENLPSSLTIARDWALSEQHDDMLRDPVGTGTRHAFEWDAQANRLGLNRKQTLVLGINEPRVWQAGVPEALRLYTIALCNQAKELGLRVGAMQLGVGWPNNTGPDTPPDWTPWHGLDKTILDGNHALVLHEYWADSGPSENWGWWAGRALKCPWNVPIVIGECGIDMFVKSAQFADNRGWLGHVTPERYAQELAEYVGRMSADSRFVGACVFASDFASHEWFSFDIEPAYQAILTTPIPVYPPVVTPPQPSIGSGYTQTHLNVRTGPGTNHPIVTTLPPGTPVTWDAQIGLWVRIGTDRWVHSGYVANQPPAPPVEPPTQDNWGRSIDFVLRMEGGFQDNPLDIGNWTGCRQGVGELKGTNMGISACSYPNLDIKNLTREAVMAIYHRDYWRASGADTMEWPLCLLIFDTSVLHGVAAAKAWLAEVGPNPYLFAAKRLRVYTQSGNWGVFGAGWVNRVAALLEEMAK